MKMKCEHCRFYGTWLEKPVCNNSNAIAVSLDISRDICDREGDGHFVYFEPKHPQAGACFVQITREQPKTLAQSA